MSRLVARAGRRFFVRHPWQLALAIVGVALGVAVVTGVDLAGSATVPSGIDPDAPTAVCCGPNTVYFSKVTTLAEMVDHIYGRARLPLSTDRPHMFLKELSLHLDRLKREMERRRIGIARAADKGPAEIRDNLLNGIRLYRETAASLVRDRKDEFLARLEKMRGDLDDITS